VREAVSLGVHGFVMKRSGLSELRTAIRRCYPVRNILSRQPAAAGRQDGRRRCTLGVNLTSREREVLRGYARGENPKGPR